MSDGSAQPRFSADEVSKALGCQATFLGAGTFGDTWRVANEAIKVICKDDYPRARIEREVEGLRRVDSPFVVSFKGTLELNLGGTVRPALRFEYISGGDLERKRQQNQRVPMNSIEPLLKGLLIGAQALHKASTIHRDIKPGNIVLRGGDWNSPVLLDLGLAKQLDSSTITVYPGHIGTYPYMAPEQLQGMRARKSADLWAIGVTVREMICGRHPFYEPGQAFTIDEAMDRLAKGPIPLPTDCPSHIRGVLDRLTSVAEHERGSSNSNLSRLGDKR